MTPCGAVCGINKPLEGTRGINRKVPSESNPVDGNARREPPPSGANEAGGGAEQLGDQQQPGHDKGEEEGPADGVPRAAGIHRGHQAVDQDLGESDDGDGEDALDDEQGDPRDGPAPRGGPDQVEGAWEIGELCADFFELGGDQRIGFGHRERLACEKITGKTAEAVISVPTRLIPLGADEEYLFRLVTSGVKIGSRVQTRHRSHWVESIPP